MAHVHGGDSGSTSPPLGVDDRRYLAALDRVGGHDVGADRQRLAQQGDVVSSAQRPSRRGQTAQTQSSPAQQKSSFLRKCALILLFGFVASLNRVVGTVRAKHLGRFSGAMTSLVSSVAYLLLYFAVFFWRYWRGYISCGQVRFVWGSWLVPLPRRGEAAAAEGVEASAEGPPVVAGGSREDVSPGHGIHQHPGHHRDGARNHVQGVPLVARHGPRDFGAADEPSLATFRGPGATPLLDPSEEATKHREGVAIPVDAATSRTLLGASGRPVAGRGEYPTAIGGGTVSSAPDSRGTWWILALAGLCDCFSEVLPPPGIRFPNSIPV